MFRGCIYHIIALCWLSLTFVSAIKKNFDDSVLFRVNWPGGPVPDELANSMDSELLQMMTPNNEKYQCFLPKVSDFVENPVTSYHGKNALELMKPLFSQMACSFKVDIYWTYELCHGQHIQQFHEDRTEGSKQPTVQQYFLGKWDTTQFDELSAEMDKKVSVDPNYFVPTRKIEGSMVPYLEVVMDGGTVCDINSEPRRTKVHYICYPPGKHEIYSMEEVSTCEYEVVVLTPLLCSHPKYKAVETAQNEIKCHPVAGASRKPKNLVAIEEEALAMRKDSQILETVQSDGTRIRFEIKTVAEEDDQEDLGEFIKIVSKKDEDGWKSAPPRPPVEPVFDPKLVEDFLSGEHCLHGGTGWWKYELCYEKKVDQYHMEQDGRKTIIHLGIFDKKRHLSWLEQYPHKSPRYTLDRKYVTHFYSEGSICDETGQPRHVEVKLKCQESSTNPNSVSLYLLEPKICEYILGVESPIVCPLLKTVDEHGFFHSPSSMAEEEVPSSVDSRTTPEPLTDDGTENEET